MTEHFDVIVIGGGPAGSTTASFLEQMGHDVLLLEKESFPRHHIGESMIAASLDVLAELGLEEKLAAAEFPVKSGGCFLGWGESDEPWCIRFDEIEGRPTSYQVERSVFDKILLDHAAELGVDVRERHRVTDVLYEEGRIVGVEFEDVAGIRRQARAEFTVDASGLAAAIANKVSRRLAVDELQNMCLYGYWKGDHPPPAALGGEIRESDRNNILIKMIEDGWLWFIPLGRGLISVGYVTPRDRLPKGGKALLEEHYLDRVRSAPEWQYLLGHAEYSGEFHTVKDWSYRSEAMAGPGYFAVGDAACFVDPILSSGAYLAIVYAKMAAVGINTCLRFPARQELVQEWYEGIYSDGYQDYLRMARFWYHGARRVGDWMEHAKEALVEEAGSAFAETDRSSFIGLATGNAHVHPNYVLVRELRSFPLPLYLRKDPRGRFHEEAQVALLGHADKAAFSPELHDAIDRSAAAMAMSPARRKRVQRLLEGAATEVSAKLEGAQETGPWRGRATRLTPGSQVSLEVIDDLVAMVVIAPDGQRRILDVDEEGALATLVQGGDPESSLEAGRLYQELVAAGVVADGP